MNWSWHRTAFRAFSGLGRSGARLHHASVPWRHASYDVFKLVPLSNGPFSSCLSWMSCRSHGMSTISPFRFSFPHVYHDPIVRSFASSSSSSSSSLSHSPDGSTSVKELTESLSSSPSFIIDSSLIRNIAIIAHVDHGKTTLVDRLLEQSGVMKNEAAKEGSLENTETGTRRMDSHVLERERGITILSKCTSLQRGPYRINIVDTPGHADFGGEVERVLSMVDGVCLVVDATEGPMAQTKFVLSKALKRGLKPVVVLNKMDRPTVRPDAVDSELLDLFDVLGASEEQMMYPMIYACSKDGWSTRSSVPFDLNQIHPRNMDALFDAIIEHVPCPRLPRNAPFSLLINNIETNAYLGKCYMGKIESGMIKLGDKVKVLDTASKCVEEGKVIKMFVRRGLEQIAVQEAAAGDIVSIAAGLSLASINHTICAPDLTTPLPGVALDPPTLSMYFSINSSPLANKEGKAVTTQQLGERLRKECETNVALSFAVSPNGNDAFEVFGRGELQLGVLIEGMRREGMELTVSPPRVLIKILPEFGDTPLEPIEEVTIDVDEEYTGVIIEKLTKRKGELVRVIDIHSSHVASASAPHGTSTTSGSTLGSCKTGKARLIFMMPTRGLLGYASEFKNDTHGTGIMNHVFSSYEPYKGKLEVTRKGALIATTDGMTTAFALSELEPRGTLFVTAGVQVYQGMVIGESSRSGDMEVNPVRAKQVSNIRTTSKEEAIRLSPAKVMTLEETIAYVAEDEMIEVTPKSVRLRKRHLDPVTRKMSQSKKDKISLS